MMKIISSVVFLFIAFLSYSQQLTIPSKPLSKITAKDLAKTMEVLTSDSLEGRATGQIGGVKAANYIASQFKEIGLEPFENDSYFQPFLMYKKAFPNAQIAINGDTLVGSDQFIYYGDVAENEFIEKELVYIGYYNEKIINEIDLKDKIAVVSYNNLQSNKNNNNKLLNKGVWAIINVIDSAHHYSEATHRINESNNNQMLRPSNEMKPFKGLRVMVASKSAASKLLGLPDSLITAASFDIKPDNLITKNVSIRLPIEMKPFTCRNIIGIIKGSEPNNKPVVVTAHYDHVGRRQNEICRGADDNASGIAAMTELAHTFVSQNTKTKRDIWFVACDAEEIGLHGSAAFMKNYTKEDIYANVNIDMIGRIDTTGHENYVYILGTSKNPWAHELHQRANKQTVNLKLDYFYNVTEGKYNFMNRSDHHHFYKLDIPVITFFSGLHGDYHTPRDTMDKIDFNLLAKRVQLIYGTLYLLANENRLSN